MTAEVAPASVATGPPLTYPEGGLLDAIVHAHAAARPDSVALLSPGSTTSYRELSASAHRAAAVLHELGVRPGDVVAVRYPPSPAVVAALLGILECGAAYAAVPPDWPHRRCAQLLARAGARVFVTKESGWGPEVTAIELADLARDDARAGPGPRQATGADPCCVFFTSGSTGVAKAVLAPHQGIVRAALSTLLDIGGGAPVVMPAFSPIGWDGFALELWAPLIRGGTTVLSEVPDVSGTGIRQMIAGGVTVMFLTVSLLNSLLEDDPDCLAGLRRLITAGERVSPEYLAACQRRHPGLDIVHGYGPAEGTICTTVFLLPRPVPAGEIPIGTPIGNTAVYVLDNERRVVPAGVVGELAISGDGLALGYLNDPPETGRRFPTIMVAGGSARVYLTGDLVRADAAGLLWFVGRNDRQIKLRGVRIEPFELERLLEERADISRATVLGLPLNGRRVERLVVFYSSPAQAPSPESVIAHLAATLPAGFRPDLAVLVGRMPRLANGKIDSSTLAALVPEPPGAAGGSREWDVSPLPGSLEPLWRLADSMPHLHDAVVPLLFHVRGRFDPALLRAALDAVVGRSEALRSRFFRSGDRVQVRIAPPEEATGLLMVDVVSGPRPRPEAEREARRWLLGPASLTGTLPLRARLIPTADGGHLFAVAVHRIAFDARSGELFCQELTAAYDAARAKQPLPDGPEPGYYQLLAERDAQPPVTPLGSGSLAPDRGTAGPVAELTLTLAGETLDAARLAGTDIGTSARAVLLAAFTRCLRTYTGDPEVTVGVPLPGRSAATARYLGAFETTVTIGGRAGHPVPRFRFVTTAGTSAMRTSRWTAEPLEVRPANSLWVITLQLTEAPEPGAVLRYRTDLVSAQDARRLAADWAAEVTR